MFEYKTITDLKDEALAIFTSYSESQLKHFYEPAPGLFIAESPKVIKRALKAGYEPVSILFDPKYLDADPDSEDAIVARKLLEACSNIPIYGAPIDVLINLTGFNLTNGMLCAMRRKAAVDLSEMLSGKRRIAVLDDIENPTNIGAIFRSAAALGMEAVLVTENCADPLYRRAARVSMGNVFLLPWAYVKSTEYISTLKSLGFTTAAMALKDDSVSISDEQLKASEKLAIILGNEGHGLPAARIDACDYTVMIPMYHDVDSLNVAAASAVAFWELK